MCDQNLDLARVSSTFLVQRAPNSGSKPQTNAKCDFCDLWDPNFILKLVS